MFNFGLCQTLNDWLGIDWLESVGVTERATESEWEALTQSLSNSLLSVRLCLFRETLNQIVMNQCNVNYHEWRIHTEYWHSQSQPLELTVRLRVKLRVTDHSLSSVTLMLAYNYNYKSYNTYTTASIHSVTESVREWLSEWAMSLTLTQSESHWPLTHSSPLMTRSESEWVIRFIPNYFTEQSQKMAIMLIPMKKIMFLIHLTQWMLIGQFHE